MKIEVRKPRSGDFLEVCIIPKNERYLHMSRWFQVFPGRTVNPEIGMWGHEVFALGSGIHEIDDLPKYKNNPNRIHRPFPDRIGKQIRRKGPKT